MSMDNKNAFLARYVTVALWIIAIVVVIATVSGQVESFDGLYNWFASHNFTGWKAYYAPLTVDSFTIIGELAIFASIARNWSWQGRILPWISALIGIVSSVAANVGVVASHAFTWQLTAAIPPLAGAFGIIIGLGLLKRIAQDHMERKETWQEPSIRSSGDSTSSRQVTDPTSSATLMVEEKAGPSIETLEKIFKRLPEIPSPEPERLSLAPNRPRGLDLLTGNTERPSWTDIVRETVDVSSAEQVPEYAREYKHIEPAS